MSATSSGGWRVDPSILREYDIRGIVGKTLSEDDARAIGRGYGTVVRRHGGGSVAVGRDGRLSSPGLVAALIEGLTASGVDVLDVGRGPSPMLYFATRERPVDAGIMVTGSHNPSDYNGFKLVIGKESFFGERILALGALMADGDFESGQGEVRQETVEDDYVARLLEGYRPPEAPRRPLKVAWDAGNGAAGDALVKLVDRLPGEHILLYETVDGAFPNHHPDPTVEANLQDLVKAVLANGCDLGIAFDGDGDRIGAVDGQGRTLFGDQIMLLLAREVIAEQPGATIIADVKASQVLFDEIARLGGRPIMWNTGHSLIKSKMAEEGAPFAGEMSAHLFFADRYYGYDDALYAAVRLIDGLGRSDESLADFRDSLPAVVNTPEIRFQCDDDRKAGVVAEVRGRLSGKPGIEVNNIDGVRVRNADGWWLLRASNTQDVLVVRCESADEAGLDRLKATVREQLQASGIALPTDF